jgi:pilus assembly protein CpaE
VLTMVRSVEEQLRSYEAGELSRKDGAHPVFLCSSAEMADDILRMVTLFTDGERCRAALQQAPINQRVIVDSTVCDVEPVNLVAALRKDNAKRGIYLVVNDATPSQLSRAWAAGASDVITSSQARRFLLGAEEALNDTLPSVKERAKFSNARSLNDEVQDDPSTEEHEDRDTERFSTYSRSSLTPRAGTSKSGIVLSFLSGSGGTGKSTLSLIMALLFKRIGMRTVLIDLDLQFGDLRFLAEGEPLITKNDMPFTQANTAVIAHYLDESGFCFISPPLEPEIAEELIDHISPVIEAARSLADFVILNTGSFWNELHALVLENSDLICLVMDQRATSINNCKRSAELCARLEIPFSRLIYVLNRCSYRAAFSTFDCSLMVGGAPVCGVDNGGSLVEELLEVGTPGELIESKNAMVCSIAEMIDGFLREFACDETYAEQLRPYLRKKYTASIKKKQKRGGSDDAF